MCCSEGHQLGVASIVCPRGQWRILKCQDSNHESGVGHDEVSCRSSLIAGNIELRRASDSRANLQLLVI